MLIYSIVSVVMISLVSIIGLVALSFSQTKLKRAILFLVSFSTGALLGDAFLHLIPEVVSSSGFTVQASLALLGGILTFFVLEKFICWRHCHIPTSHDHPHPLATMNLVGDGLHNLIDGMIVAASYMADVRLGITTTIAVIMHEIPQEISDFGVLLHAGLSRTKALVYNFISAAFAALGLVIFYVLGSGIHEALPMMLAFTAGGFIYIASADLIPELHKETEVKKSIVQFIGIILGILVMVGLLFMD